MLRSIRCGGQSRARYRRRRQRRSTAHRRPHRCGRACPAVRCRRSTRRVEAGAVIGDLEADRVRVLVQRDHDLHLGPAVLGRVLDRLTAAVVDRRLELGRVAAHPAAADAHSRPCGLVQQRIDAGQLGRQGEPNTHRDQALLDPIVEILLQHLSLPVEGFDDFVPATRRRQGARRCSSETALLGRRRSQSGRRCEPCRRVSTVSRCLESLDRGALLRGTTNGGPVTRPDGSAGSARRSRASRTSWSRSGPARSRR